MGKRTVKLGRYMITPLIAQHWAIKVGDTWYEIAGADKNEKGAANIVKRSYGDAAASGAGALGGEIVGTSDKSDESINSYIESWLEKNPCYQFTSENCQKFAYEFMAWLTRGSFNCPHRFDSAIVMDSGKGEGNLYNERTIAFAAAEDGNAIATAGVLQAQHSFGVLQVKGSGPRVQAQAVAGPGVGVFGDASIVRAEASVGNIVGAHVDLNINTGVGARNGNVEAHLLGWGGKVGADGIEINTPVGGVNACTVM
eukprot:GFUD01008345.1.p1 GENE.GFUD01008345.1~~GFUD01008345.1.p1  ORF type:complete len:255 (+),score=49.82 GFUD01008345.1:184-948(+)